MRLWTQRVSVSWQTSVRFFQQRFVVLEQLEAEGVLWGFRVGDDEIGIQLGDPNHVLHFGPTGMQAAVLQPDGDESRVRRAMGLVIDAVEPGTFVQPSFDFQFVAALEGDYDQLRGRAAREFLPQAPGEAADVAVWVDGTTSDGEGEYFVECGVVEAAELPPRLAREHGRFTESTTLGAQSGLWPLDNLPFLAFFCDENWQLGAEVDSLDGFFAVWNQTAHDAQEIATVLMQRLHLSTDE